MVHEKAKKSPHASASQYKLPKTRQIHAANSKARSNFQAGFATASAASSDTVESYTYGRKRGRGFVQEESSESEDSSEEN